MATSRESSMQQEGEDTNDPSQEDAPSLFPGFSDVNEYSQKALRSVLMATRSSNDLPVGDDFDFYSTYRSVRDVMDFEGRRILTLMQRLLRHQNVKGTLHHEHSAELEDKFDILMDANDQILERAGTLLDEASGLRKEETKLVIVSTSTPNAKTSGWNKRATNTSKPEVAYKLMTARNIQRPQMRFRDKIDNSNLPFKPHLRHKPHAIKSLEESLKLPEGIILEETEKPDFNYPHPYLAELQSFIPGTEILQKVTPQEAVPINLTPLLYVDTNEGLHSMIEDLKTQKEIAVDLEHHSYRSFQGLTCLMQISTRSKDYIIDTLELRSEIPQLNEVFTNPNIIKVFHGADSDITWLQRDFSVYVVNMFDTGQAARLLGLSRFSLAHLMLNYCKMEVDKQYQLADWRIRPLPTELINYAREDTHYLLYIFDMMRNQLVDRGNEQGNLLMSVFDRSKTVAAKVYQKHSHKDDDFLELYRKSKKVFNNQQMAALRDLYFWRDAMARVEDESLGYVLPNHMLLQIADILPRERQGVLACCNPIPPLVRQNLMEIHNIVLQAREITLTKVEKAPVLLPSNLQHPKYNAESLLSCPHDQTRNDERIAQAEHNVVVQDLGASSLSMFSPELSSLVKQTPDITAFAVPRKQSLSKSLVQKIIDEIKASFKSYFTKYLPSDGQDLIKPQSSDMWILKASTVPKRKADNPNDKVDLNTFQPEFVLPIKKSKTEVRTEQARSMFSVPAPRNENVPAPRNENVPAGGGSSLFRVPAPRDGQVPSHGSSLFRVPAPKDGQVPSHGSSLLRPHDQDDSQEKDKQKQKEKAEDMIGRQIKSLRQQMVSQKKKIKVKQAKRERSKADAAVDTSDSQTSILMDTDHVIVDISAVPSSTAQPLSVAATGTCNSIEQSSTSGSQTGASNTKTTKKRKKKKLTLADVEENFQAFDYATAEKQLLKQKKQKPKMDVFNPSLPSRSGKHKNKVPRARLSGPKSNTAAIFPMSGKPQRNKGKKY